MDDIRETTVRSLQIRKRYIILFVAAVLMAAGALWSAKTFGTRTDLTMRRELVRQATQLAAAIPPNEAADLAFTANDLTRPEFQRLSGQILAAARQTGGRDITLVALRDGTAVCGPNSRSIPPGEPFPTVTEKIRLSLEEKTAVIEGPFPENSPPVVRAAVPVIHPGTGDAFMSVVLTSDAAEWREQIRATQIKAAIGLLIPLLALIAGWVLIAPRQRAGIRHAEAITFALVGILMTAGLTSLVYHTETEARDESFKALAGQYNAALRNIFQTLENDLNLLNGFFEASDKVTRGEFAHFSERLLSHDLICGTAWIAHVTEEERERFEQQARQETGRADYRIWEYGPDGEPRTAARRKIYHPVLYVEPLEGQQRALGFDTSSEPVREKAMQKADQHTLPVATEPVTLAVGRPQPAILVFQQVGNRQGLTALSFDPTRVLHALLARSASSEKEVSISLYECTADQPPRNIACTDPKFAQDINCCQKKNRLTAPIFAFGRCYWIDVAPARTWLLINPLRSAPATAVGGLLLTAAMSWLIGVLANRPRLLEKQVRERTAELRASEERFLLATEAGGIGVWDRDIVNDRLTWDDRMYELYGVNKTDFGGAHEAWQQCLHPDDLERAVAEVSAAETGKKGFNTEFRIVRPDGTIRRIRAFAKVIHDEAGRPVRMTGTNQDITDQHSKQEQLRMQANVLDQIQDYVTVTDLEGRITYLNQAELNLFEKPAEELIGRSVDAFGDDPEQGATQKEIIQKTRSNGIWRGEVVNHKADGSSVIMDCRTQLLRDSTGTPVGMVGISTDITERLKAEQKLKENEAKLRGIIENSTNMFYSHTPDHVLTFLSPQVKDILGYEVKEALKKWTEMATDHPINEQGFELTETAIRTGEAQPAYELQLRHKDGHPVWVEVHEAPVVENEKTVAIVGSLTDITARKEAEEKLRDHMEELERFNKASVGRELRMIELKKEINALYRELGRKEPYGQ